MNVQRDFKPTPLRLAQPTSHMDPESLKNTLQDALDDVRFPPCLVIGTRIEHKLFV